MSFKNNSVDIECPRCKKMFAVPLLQLIPGHILPCPACGREIAFTAEDLQTLRDSGSRVDSEEV